MEPVDVYLRKSTEDGRRSVQRQLADMTQEAAPMGLTIRRTFVDPDLSASRFARKARPDFAALLAHIGAGGCGVLGIVEASRGSRSLTEWSALLDLCRTMSVRIWVQTHGRIYDLSRRRDWRTLAEDGIDAADESERISDRVRSGALQAALAGRPGGRHLFGYERHYELVHGRPRCTSITPHPTEAAVVAELVERVAEGEPLRRIARDLDARGIRTSTGAVWHSQQIRQTVLRPSYVGQRVHRGAVIGDAMWPALVDPDLWRQACAVLTRPERAAQARGSALVHWLTGAVQCLRCGSMVGHSGGYTYRCSGCTMTAASDTLEAVIEAALMARLDRADARRLFRTPAGPPIALRRAERAAQAIRDHAAANDAAYRAGEISPRLAGLREAELDAQLQHAEAEVARLTLPDELADLAGVDIPSVWHNLAPAKRRAVARRLAVLRLTPAPRRGPVFDPHRLDGSRWTNDTRTWGQLVRHPAE